MFKERYEIKVKTVHPIYNENMWIIEDIALSLGGVQELLDLFIKENYHKDYSLIIRDSISNRNIFIDCIIDDIPYLTNYIYNMEKATPLTFRYTYSKDKAYVVEMSLKNCAKYIYKNKRLIQT